jgi:L-Ala-D/L-Glu epimerase
MTLHRISVRQLRLPLATPYKVSLLTLREFDPFVIEVFDDEGATGFGEALIVPGYTAETVEGSWELCNRLSRQAVGLSLDDARSVAARHVNEGAGAASALLAALDMLAGHPMLEATEDFSIPLLAPLHADEHKALAAEIEARLDEGFRTLKVKVGFDWEGDLQRLRHIQSCVRGRATLRLDANQGYSVEDGCAFARALNPEGIELFEQPCHMDDWRGNAAVAAVSTVPVMLDESIYGIDDVARAAEIRGVGFVKLKLKKIGSVDMLARALHEIRSRGLTPVLGDGVSMEIGCWMEACVARTTIDNAGEMNGFLKTRDRLFETPLAFGSGSIRIPAGFRPRLERTALERHTVRRMDHDAPALAPTIARMRQAG